MTFDYTFVDVIRISHAFLSAGLLSEAGAYCLNQGSLSCGFLSASQSLLLAPPRRSAFRMRPKLCFLCGLNTIGLSYNVPESFY